MRANVSGWSRRWGPRGAGQRRRLLVVRDPGGGAAGHVADLLLGEAGEQCRAQGQEQRAGLLPVGVVGRVHDLAGRDSRVHVHQVDRAPDRRVSKKTPCRPAKHSESAARSAMPAWAMISDPSG